MRVLQRIWEAIFPPPDATFQTCMAMLKEAEAKARDDCHTQRIHEIRAARMVFVRESLRLGNPGANPASAKPRHGSPSLLRGGA